MSHPISPNPPSRELALGPRETMLAMLHGRGPIQRARTPVEPEPCWTCSASFKVGHGDVARSPDRTDRNYSIVRLRVAKTTRSGARRGPTRSPPAAPLRIDLKPAPPQATTDESASWLLDRLNTLETESRSTWKDLLGRDDLRPSSREPTPPPTRPVARAQSAPRNRVRDDSILRIAQDRF